MKRLLLPLVLIAFALACGSGGSHGGPLAGPGAYIALGDSLSEGVGASDRATTAFVPLVHQGLGDDFELINLGHSGDTSGDLIDHGHLDEAVAAIGARNGDDDDGNDVKLVTLEIGGNDLLNLYFSEVVTGMCPDLQTALNKPDCVNPLRTAFERFQPNLDRILGQLKDADPAVPIVLLTLYNPFSGRIPVIAELAGVALEGRPDTPFAEGLNDIIRAIGGEHGVFLVDLYPLFEGKGGELVAQDLIHPNDAGYQVMADAVLAALADVP